MTYVRNAQNKKSVTCSCVPNCLDFVLGARLAGSSFKVIKKDYCLVFITVWVLSLKILGRLRGDLC